MSTAVNQSSSELDESTTGIQQLSTKFKELSEQSIGDENNLDIRRKLWQRFLELLTEMIQLPIDTATITLWKYLDKCTDTFPAILDKVNIDRLLSTDSSLAHQTFFT